MKTFRITYTATVTDDFFKDEGVEIKNEILSGKMQREMKSSEGVKKVVITFEEIK